MQTCGPRAKARWRAALGRSTSKRSGSGNAVGIAVGGRDRDPDEVAAPDRRAAELHVARRVAVEHRGRGLEPQRLLDRAREQAPGRPPPARAGPDARAGAATALAIIPSVVSMPPNISTAALETTSSRSSPAASSRDRGDERVGRVAVERRPERVAQRRERRAPALAQRPALGELVDRLDDPVVPAEHDRPAACRAGRARASPPPRRAGRRSCAAARSARPARRRRSAARSPRRPSAVKRSRTASSRNGRGERRAVAAVLGAVEREHARPDDAAGREARVVDRERLRRVHHLHREVAPRDEPAVEHRHPRHRLAARAAARAARRARRSPRASPPRRVRYPRPPGNRRCT